MDKVIKIVSAVILIAGLSYGGYKLFSKGEKSDDTEIIKADKKKDTKKKEAPLPVKITTVEKGDLPLRLRISATADAWERAFLKTEVTGKVEKLSCKVGQMVKKGQVLLKIEDYEKALALRRAEAEKYKALSAFLVKEDTSITGNQQASDADMKKLAELKKKYLKALKDYEKGRISEAKMDAIAGAYEKVQIFTGSIREELRKAQEGVSQAVVNVKQARLDLAKTVIKAPFDGIISEIKISKGQQVSSGVDAIKVVNLKSVYLKGHALESEVAKLKNDVKVRIKMDSYPDKFFYGSLQSVSPEVNEEKKTITVYIKVENENNLILPGMNSEVDIEYKVMSGVVKVPANTIIARQDRYLVFKIKDRKGTKGIAIWQYVKTGARNDEEVEILEGLNGGETVVTDGHLTLGHQSKIKIVK